MPKFYEHNTLIYDSNSSIKQIVFLLLSSRKFSHISCSSSFALIKLIVDSALSFFATVKFIDLTEATDDDAAADLHKENAFNDLIFENCVSLISEFLFILLKLCVTSFYGEHDVRALNLTHKFLTQLLFSVNFIFAGISLSLTREKLYDDRMETREEKTFQLSTLCAVMVVKYYFKRREQ
jgi:hypothetical protein